MHYWLTNVYNSSLRSLKILTSISQCKSKIFRWRF